jgi:hypothetical protein
MSISIDMLAGRAEQKIYGDLLDIGAVWISKPIFALDNARHCREFSLASTSIVEHI